MQGKADLVRWVRGLEAAEQRIDAERRAHPMAPDEALTRASELNGLARSLGVLAESGAPSDEDLEVYRTWVRLRAVLHPVHA